jgi:hypothetical protein
MGVLIGASETNSTWGRNRTPIFSTYFGISGNVGAHNNVATDGWASEANTFFRCSQWWTAVSWLDSGGVVQNGILGPLAFPGSPFPPSTLFLIGGYNTDPAEAYAPNYLDDVEVQNVWVGRDVVIDSTTYAMSYSALNGVTGSFQTITSSADVVSFDL